MVYYDNDIYDLLLNPLLEILSGIIVFFFKSKIFKNFIKISFLYIKINYFGVIIKISFRPFFAPKTYFHIWSSLK